MRKKAYWILPVIAIVAVSLAASGCTKKVAEKTAEKAIEAATNGQADVDIDDNTLTINTDTGSYQAGDSVSLPDNFPSDVYVIDGTIKAAVANTQNESFVVSIQTSTSVDDAKTQYVQQLADDGWTIGTNMTYAGAVTLISEKDNRTLSVGIMEVDNQTTVNLNVATESASDSMQTPDDIGN
ncbi:MAG: hypothetical protein WC544_02100 [Patescibacteria group bacterium]